MLYSLVDFFDLLTSEKIKNVNLEKKHLCLSNLFGFNGGVDGSIGATGNSSEAA